jgi:L-aspartate oxidase
VRSGEGLREALARIERLEQALPDGPSEVRNLATIGRLVARAALARKESRGAHFRADHPASDPAWRRRLVLWRTVKGLGLSSEGLAARTTAAVGVPA